MRSIPSTSRVTCSASTSATLRGRLIFGSGTTPVPRDQPPLCGPNEELVSPVRPEPFLNYLGTVGAEVAKQESARAKTTVRGERMEQRSPKGRKGCKGRKP